MNNEQILKLARECGAVTHGYIARYLQENGSILFENMKQLQIFIKALQGDAEPVATVNNWSDITWHTSLVDIPIGTKLFASPPKQESICVDCPKCKGKGTYDTSCSYCGDSTFDHECNDTTYACKSCNGSGKLYTSPKREWVGLSDEDIENLIGFAYEGWAKARTIERKLRELNI